ncbi:MAG: hypothetical protein KQI35_04370 [Bacteroidetes bacterium]|nr:hypothetical protein [Bacteroidota bacterium]
MNRKTWALAILLILPSIFLYVGNNFNRAVYAGDPDYIYLMNAINLARGKDAGHIDNPGTPVMEIGAGLLYVHYFLDQPNENTLQESVLKDPNKYLELIQKLLILLITLSLIFAGWFFFVKTGSIWVALIIQMTPFMSVNVLERSWTTVAPEPVLLFVTTIYAVLLASFYFDEKRPALRYLILFSVFGGLGLATKATFLPLLVIPLFLFSGWRPRLYYFMGTVAAFFFFTVPAHKLYGSMFRWFSGLVVHKGIYGKGEPGFIDFSEYLDNIFRIFMDNHLFSSVLVLAVVIIAVYLIKHRRSGLSLNSRVLLALIVANGLGVLIVAKHFHHNHYLLPELSLTGLLFFFSIETAGDVFRQIKWKTPLNIIFLIVVILIFVLKSVPLLQIKNDGYRYTNNQFEEVSEFIEKNYPGYTKIYHYPDGLNKISAIKFGNGYSKLSNQTALSELYPQAYFFNVMTGNFQLWETPIMPERIVEKHGNNIIIIGRQIDHHGMQIINGFGIWVKPVFKKLFQAVYVIDSISPALKKASSQFERRINCDMESLTENGDAIKAGDQVISGPTYRTREISRSGDFSIKMDKDTQYAFRFKLDSIHANQAVEIRIWRYPEYSAGTLVVSAENPELFYQATSLALETDSKGWQLLELTFEVPDVQPRISYLNIYFRNKEAETLYFDDLEVIIR